MPMTELERKAAFKHACTMKRTTMGRAAREIIGVSLHHLNEGIADRRVLSDAVQERFSAFIGTSRVAVFGDLAPAAA